LTREKKMAPVADDWVQRMIDTPGRSGQLLTGDHLTHYLEWGDASNARIMLLLHGFRGHAHWWDFIAPWFAREYRVIAMDFAGMGDSSYRPRYTRASFVGEVHAMLEMLGSKAILVGHSFGGRIAVLAAHQYPQLLERVLVIDSDIGFADNPVRHRFPPRPKRIYADRASARERFRFTPDEPAILPGVMRHIAEHSLRQEADGFVWKFDEVLLTNFAFEPVMDGELLKELMVPMDFIAGEFSAVVPPDLANRIGRELRSHHGRGPIVIPAAYHHIPVDQPLASVAAMRALLS
jgi:pimeloyl-ACP methyl ester carboxylesterase